MGRSTIDIVTDPAADLLSVALACHELGWCVLRTEAGTKKPKGQWKRYQQKRPSAATLRRWFREPDGCGLAVMMGAVSDGLIVRDFDDMASYGHWASEHPKLAETLPTVKTGRPGRHVYGRASLEQIESIGNAFITFDDGELRLQNCICMLPPSNHPDGPQYRWLIPPTAEISVVDLQDAGFLECYGDVTESTESTERTESTETTECTEGTEAIRCVGGCSTPRAASTPALSALLERHDELSARISAAIKESLPSRPGRRNKQVFEFCRSLKAIPEIAGLAGTDLDRVVRAWHKKALPAISTKPFEETWIDFLRAWPKVKFPRGDEPIGHLLEAARQSIPAVAEQFEQPALKLLVSLCRELQRSAGDKPFYLSCRTAGGLLEVDHMTAARWLYLLAHSGILTEVQKGVKGSGRATRYRYIAEGADEA